MRRDVYKKSIYNKARSGINLKYKTDEAVRYVYVDLDSPGTNGGCCVSPLDTVGHASSTALAKLPPSKTARTCELASEYWTVSNVLRALKID